MSYQTDVSDHDADTNSQCLTIRFDFLFGVSDRENKEDQNKSEDHLQSETVTSSNARSQESCTQCASSVIGRASVNNTRSSNACVSGKSNEEI